LRQWLSRISADVRGGWLLEIRPDRATGEKKHGTYTDSAAHQTPPSPTSPSGWFTLSRNAGEGAERRRGG
jgi:hypothetical protein